MGQYYYPQEPKEPSGCMQTIIITRMIFSILAVPVAIIAGAMFTLIMTIFLYTVSPPLALIPLTIGVIAVVALGRWEFARVERERRLHEDE